VRFEIGSGGAFLILAGLIGLSAAVFALGLVAGFQIAHRGESDSGQVAAIYPAPSPPPAQAPSSPAEQPVGARGVSAALSVGDKAPAAGQKTSPQMSSAESPRALTEVPVASARAAKAAAIGPSALAEGLKQSSREPGPGGAEASRRGADGHSRRRPYNIQIGAVMDQAGAEDMMARLRKLGYQPSTVAVMLGGKRWYRVRIGPYDTREQAKVALDRLRKKYRTAYTTR